MLVCLFVPFVYLVLFVITSRLKLEQLRVGVEEDRDDTDVPCRLTDAGSC